MVSQYFCREWQVSPCFLFKKKIVKSHVDKIQLRLLTKNSTLLENEGVGKGFDFNIKSSVATGAECVKRDPIGLTKNLIQMSPCHVLTTPLICLTLRHLMFFTCFFLLLFQCSFKSYCQQSLWKTRIRISWLPNSCFIATFTWKLKTRKDRSANTTTSKFKNHYNIMTLNGIYERRWH